MVDGNEQLILHPLHGQLVVLVGVLRFRNVLRGQGDAAAAHHGLPGGVEHIAADGADIELGTQEVGGPVLVDHGLSLHQFQYRDAQRGRQRFQQGNVGQALGRLPLGDGLGADRELCSKLCLGEVFDFPQLSDGAAGDVSVHGAISSFSLHPAYHRKTLRATYAAWSV